MAYSRMSLGKTCRYYEPDKESKFVMEIFAFSDDNTNLQWRGGRGGGGREQGPPSDNFLGALKFAIANAKYLTKYIKSSLSTNSKW